MNELHQGTGSPLTRAQEALWASQQMHPDVPLYNMAFVFHIDGALDEGAFVIRGALPGMQPPIAFIANSEKGAVNVRLRVNVSLTMHDPSHRAAPHATASGAGRP